MMEMENGKIKVKSSLEVSVLGFTVKIKDYELSGDINKAVEMVTSIVDGDKGAPEVMAAGYIADVLGIKKETMNKLIKALGMKPCK